MTWTKLGAEFPQSPKMLLVPDAIKWWQVAALVYSNQHGTDGEIPVGAVSHFSDETDASVAVPQLIAAGLWEPTETGFRIVGFEKDQPKAAHVERIAASGRERQRRRQLHLNGDHKECRKKYCPFADDDKPVSNASDSRGSNASDSRVSNNARTEPSVPPEPQRSGGEAGRTGRAAATAVPLTLHSGDGGPPVSQFATAGVHWSTSK